jgi:tetratricopeptide (TPR) repeat protein
MHRNSRPLAVLPLALCGLAFAALAPATQAAPPPTSSSGLALRSVFSPWRAPAAKTMGLAQRSFLDVVETSQPRLEVAIVVDGTDSMGAEIDGIRDALSQMIADLRRYKSNQVAFQLVVYRDAGAASGEIVFPLNVPDRRFTADEAILRAGVESIKAESGAPYFPELVDLGVHEALTTLTWTTDDETSRWVLLFGDAPPYEAGFDEPDSRAKRRIATDQLVSTARRLGVHVHCVLCKSRSEDQPVYDQVVEQTRSFMNTLSGETEGLMLDLSYPDIRSALEQAVKTKDVTYQEVGRISRGDVEGLREQAKAKKSLLAEGRRVRIAVLPHMPLTDVGFDPAREEVQVATELEQRFARIPGAEVRSAAAVERNVALLSGRGVRGEGLLQALAAAVRVDYVVWGAVSRSGDVVRIESAIYDPVTGKKLIQDSVQSSPQLNLTQLTGRLATNLIRETISRNVDGRLAATFTNFQQSAPVQQAVLSPVARTVEARNAVNEGFAHLERALEFSAGEEASREPLEKALAKLDESLGMNGDPTNPFAHLLLASCHRNLAALAAREERADDAAKHQKEALEALNKAYRFRNEAEYAYLKREIEADYLLMVKQDIPAAIKAYTELAQTNPDTSLRTALRAHWMLAGVYSGDWGVAPEHINADQARQALVKIMAHWPDTSEARFIERNLRWDGEQGENRFEYFPRTNEPVAPPAAETALAPK